MAHNNQSPDFEKMNAAYSALSVEDPHLWNMDPHFQPQLPLDFTQGVQQPPPPPRVEAQHLQPPPVFPNFPKDIRNPPYPWKSLEELDHSLQETRRRLIAVENSVIQIRNRQIQMDPASVLLPLLDPISGKSIDNCPTTTAQIYKLSAAEATRLLETLQVPIPRSMAAKRAAVARQFL